VKAALEVWQDAAVIRIMDDNGQVIDRYETTGIDIENYQHKKKYADPEGTLPIAARRAD
jgi:glutamine cyclotransferase